MHCPSSFCLNLQSHIPPCFSCDGGLNKQRTYSVHHANYMSSSYFSLSTTLCLFICYLVNSCWCFMHSNSAIFHLLFFLDPYCLCFISFVSCCFCHISHDIESLWSATGFSRYSSSTSCWQCCRIPVQLFCIQVVMPLEMQNLSLLTYACWTVHVMSTLLHSTFMICHKVK